MTDICNYKLYKNVWVKRESPHFSLKISFDAARRMLAGGVFCKEHI